MQFIRQHGTKCMRRTFCTQAQLAGWTLERRFERSLDPIQRIEACGPVALEFASKILPTELDTMKDHYTEILSELMNTNSQKTASAVFSDFIQPNGTSLSYVEAVGVFTIYDSEKCSEIRKLTNVQEIKEFASSSPTINRVVYGWEFKSEIQRVIETFVACIYPEGCGVIDCMSVRPSQRGKKTGAYLCENLVNEMKKEIPKVVAFSPQIQHKRWLEQDMGFTLTKPVVITLNTSQEGLGEVEELSTLIYFFEK